MHVVCLSIMDTFSDYVMYWRVHLMLLFNFIPLSLVFKNVCVLIVRLRGMLINLSSGTPCMSMNLCREVKYNKSYS